MSTLESRLQDFFFRAALATYAGEGPEPAGGQSGSIVYRYEESDLVYVDTYYVNGKWSAGLTQILLDSELVWVMSYRGQVRSDDPEIIPFLKSALKDAYSRNEFRGGRGPEQFRSSGLVYENHPDGYIHGRPMVVKFRNFSGVEYIFREGSSCLHADFSYHYWGGATADF